MNDLSLSKMRWKLFLLGVFKIPMINYVRPKLISCSDNEMCIRIPYRRRTKNHLNSMYFGAMNVGADLAAGLFVFYHSERIKKKVSLAFKSAKGEFIKRPESHVDFICDKGVLIQTKMEEAINTNARTNFSLPVEARNTEGELVALFEMVVSIRMS